MTDDDIKLSRLLASWKGISPGNGFEEAVWRKVKTAPLISVESDSGSGSFLALIMRRPVWLNAVAASLGVIVGISVSLAHRFGSRDAEMHNESRPHSGALSGAYISMLRGGPK